MVSVDQIKKLRESSGAGIADCREALENSGGDLAKAAEYLHQKGLEKAEKKSDRETGTGQVFSYVHGGKVGVLLLLRCETDFVARTAEFQTLGKELCLQVASMAPAGVEELIGQEYIRDSKLTIGELLKLTIAKLGENIKVAEISRLSL